MFKIEIIMDEEKIKKQSNYDIKDIYNAIDDVFKRYDLVKAEKGFYLPKGTKNDFANFWSAIFSLKKQQWFLPFVQKWIWYECLDDKPQQYDTEDLVQYYKNKQNKGA